MTHKRDTGSDPTPRDRASRQRVDGRARYVPGIVVTQPELVTFLVRSADEYANELCDEPNCEVCNAFCYSWHDLYSALDATYRAGIEEALEALDIRSPRPRDGGF